MSYVRWSSDGFKSDVYVYEGPDKVWITHVACRRRSTKDATGSYQQQGVMGEKLWFKDHTHPAAGKIFNHSTPEDCALNLIALREDGFHVPQFAIDELMEEHIREHPHGTLINDA